MVRDRDREPEQRRAEDGIIEERGLDDEDVGRVARSVERVVDDVDVAGGEAAAEALEQGRHRLRDRAELERDRDGLRDRLGRRAAQRRGVVHRIADDSRVGRAEDRRRHLVGRRLERVRDEPYRDRCLVRLGRRRRDVDRGQHERARRRVEHHGPAGRDDHCRVVLVDEQRPVHRRGKLGAAPHRNLDVPVARPEVGLPRPAGGRLLVREREPRRLSTERDQAERPDVDR
jgi:hypothetical protein